MLIGGTNTMTLTEMNQKYENMRHTKNCLEKAMKKFEGTENVENYLSYETLSVAYECVSSAMDRFLNRDWK